MNDSNGPDSLEERYERNRRARIEAVKRWVAYIESEPPEKWGPQQNAVVDDQLEAAQGVRASAEHHRRVETLAEEIADARDRSE